MGISKWLRYNDKVISYTRTSEIGETMLVVCNFSAETIKWKNDVGRTKEVVLSSNDRSLNHVEGRVVALDAYEAMAVILGG